MVDVRIVAAVLVFALGVNAAVSVWNSRAQFQIPPGHRLQCDIVKI